MQVNALQFDDENGYSAKIVAGSECLDSGGAMTMMDIPGEENRVVKEF